MTTSARTNWWIVSAGVALFAGFFLNWVDFGGVFGWSAWNAVWDGHGDLLDKAILLAVPVMGVVLALAGLSGGKPAANTGLLVGGLILSYAIYKVAWAFFKTTGIGLWLVLAAAVIALIIGLASKSRS